MKKLRLIYLAATALLFAACANDDEGGGNNSPVAAIVRADISQNINTRGTADNNEWTVGDAIGVFVLMDGNTKGTNVKYVATDASGNFSSETPIYFMDDKEQTFSAYYPYQTSNGDIDEYGWLKTPWTISYTAPSETLAYDFLCTNSVAARKTSPVVAFKDMNGSGETDESKDHRFKHKMAFVEFKIQTGAGVEGYYNELKKITLKNIKAEGRVNLKTGGCELTGSAEPQTMEIGKSMSNAITCQFILFPQKVENNKLDLEFGVKYNNDIDNVYTASIDLPNGFESGKKYTYTITVKNTSVTIEKADIYPWENGASSSLDANIQ